MSNSTESVADGSHKGAEIKVDCLRTRIHWRDRSSKFSIFWSRFHDRGCKWLSSFHHFKIWGKFILPSLEVVCIINYDFFASKNIDCQRSFAAMFNNYIEYSSLLSQCLEHPLVITWKIWKFRNSPTLLGPIPIFSRNHSLFTQLSNFECQKQSFTFIVLVSPFVSLVLQKHTIFTHLFNFCFIMSQKQV